MNLPRILEPEVMDTVDDARDYDAMDHRQVNRAFVHDLISACSSLAIQPDEILDLGTGTAQIPIELCRQCDDCRIIAVDAATHMLDLAYTNIQIAGLGDRIQLDRVDAKHLSYRGGMFRIVMSNSILHHIPEPREVLREAIRVTAPTGALFFRDLTRPATEDALQQLVDTYAGQENPHARQLFADSLHAALTVDEVRSLVAEWGFPADSVQQTSDRHWTWIGHRSTAKSP